LREQLQHFDFGLTERAAFRAAIPLDTINHRAIPSVISASLAPQQTGFSDVEAAAGARINVGVTVRLEEGAQ
jgi:hypothetical protein